MTKHFLKINLIFVLVGFMSQYGLAQDREAAETDSLWNTSGSVALTFANVGLENWAGGGVSSVSLGFVGNYKATRESEKTVWSNQFDLAYGLLKQKGNRTFRKTDDQLIILSQYGYKLNENWLLSGTFNFRSQIAPGYVYSEDNLGNEVRTKISNFLAPGYLTVNTGITYKNKDVFTATLAPITLKNTFVLDDDIEETQFGLDAGKDVRSEFGINLLATFKKEVMENVTFSSNLGLFASYSNLGAIDVNWETLLSMKVNKFINVTFGTQLIYDEDILIDGKNSLVQFKHALNVGLGYNF